ncbi:MAG: hypothetical protein GY865_19450 [candidate division Zixibacteria bacterium]|nr:hypothetical protein [candidate division Zixibacteria bacterium]
MKPKRIFLILIFVLVGTQCMSAQSWEQILSRYGQNIAKIKYSDNPTEKELIVQSFIKNKTTMDQIEVFLEKKYSPILISLYLSEKLKNNIINDALLSKLNTFYNAEQSSTSCYYLSYYYLKLNKLDLCTQYLVEGNQKNDSMNNKSIKRIIFDFIIGQKQSKQSAFFIAGFIFDSDQIVLLRRLSRELSKKSIKKNILLKFGSNIEKNNVTIIERSVGIAIQMNALDKQNNAEKYESLSERYNVLFDLTKKINNRSGEKELFNYLQFVYTHGEYHALKNLK